MNDLAAIAARLAADEPALMTWVDFSPFVAQGIGSGASLIIGDQSEINLFATAEATTLDHRMAQLAQPGDIVLVRRRDPEFEAYLRTHLGIKNVTFLEMGTRGDIPVTKQARQSSSLINSLAELAKKSGGLTIKSYLTTGNTWLLAKAIGEAAECCVHVCGPTPRITRRVNNKLWFSRLARAVIGTDSTPPTISAYGPAATAGLVSRISKTAAHVIVKVPDSAGSVGNIKLNSDAVRDTTIADLRSFLLARLKATGWNGRYPVLVGVWDENVLCSPSAQLWIPRVKEGLPYSEGIFEQKVANDEAKFVGATRSTLPERIQNQLVAQATQIASVLQQLGYFGRCSFDAVVCPSAQDRDIIHWIECNGRWGGVSIPMALAKAVQEPHAGGLLILQEQVPDMSLTTGQVLARFADLLFQKGSHEEGILLLSPATLPAGTSLNVLVLAKTQADAEKIAAEAVSRISVST